MPCARGTFHPNPPPPFQRPRPRFLIPFLPAALPEMAIDRNDRAGRQGGDRRSEQPCTDTGTSSSIVVRRTGKGRRKSSREEKSKLPRTALLSHLLPRLSHLYPYGERGCDGTSGAASVFRTHCGTGLCKSRCRQVRALVRMVHDGAMIPATRLARFAEAVFVVLFARISKLTSTEPHVHMRVI